MALGRMNKRTRGNEWVLFVVDEKNRFLCLFLSMAMHEAKSDSASVVNFFSHSIHF